MPSTIRTFTGVLIDPLNPDPYLFDIVDIAHSLSGEGRYCNHTSQTWTVGKHSLLVSELCRPEFAYDGLCHDFGETYMGDMVRPMKQHVDFIQYRKYEDQLMYRMAARWGFAWPEPAIVKLVDQFVCEHETRVFMRPNRPWPKDNPTAMGNAQVEDLIKKMAKVPRRIIRERIIKSFYDLRTERCFPPTSH
jgi:hypothetical protein